MTDRSAELVDWADAATLAGLIVPPGPVADRRELDALVASLRRAAARAVAPVVSITELLPADGRDLTSDPISGVLVVDRPGWARASAASMRTMTDGRLRLADRPIPLPAALASSAEVASVLAFMSTKILGQFDPYAAPERNLLLVAPNVLHVEREMAVAPEDFRLWVCLHEQTHALQFAAAPWLAEHLLTMTGSMLDGLGATRLGPWQATLRVAGFVRSVYAAVRGRSGHNLLDGMLDPALRETFDRITAVMSLLEGHAEVAMDAVGPRVVPSVRHIRRKFTARRNGTETDRVLHRLLGMDVKLEQYRSGAAFVRAVTASVGTQGLNAVWSTVDTLPTVHEIGDPTAWVRRVHG